jgi:baculoviral IAP repeat-containing protein 7/8
LKDKNYNYFLDGVHLRLKANTLIPSNLGICEWSRSKFPRFSAMTRRLKTFRDWPKCLAQKPQVLATAGFFYTGVGDRVVCFYCGLGLKDWDPEDDAFKQHVIWRSWCQYLAMTKGADYVLNSVHFTSQAIANQFRLLSTTHSNEKKSSQNLMRCINCKDNCINTVNLPCGHMTLCVVCSTKEKKCILCNCLMMASVNVFIT